MSFYIELWPAHRKKMLAMLAKALAPNGKLLFVGHNKSDPPSGWSEGDLRSLEELAEIPIDIRGVIVKYQPEFYQL